MKTAKRTLALSILTLLAAFAGSAQAALLSPANHGTPSFFLQAEAGTITGQEPQLKKTEPYPDPNEPITRTYELKYIDAEEFMKAAKIYVFDFTAAGNILIVQTTRRNAQDLEALMKKLDVEKKTIQMKVYAVYARRNAEADASAGKSPAATRLLTASRSDSDSRTERLPPADQTREQLVNMKHRNTSSRTILRFLAEHAGMNIVFETEVDVPITCDLKEVPWSEALDFILKQAGAGKSIEGKTLRIIPLQVPMTELKKVLDELRALWNFTSFETDGPSFITVRESSGSANFKLVTDRPLNLSVTNVKVKGDEPGKRSISIERLKLSGVDTLYIDTTDVSLKEKGYLVAGVSGYGSASQALILVISAEIK